MLTMKLITLNEKNNSTQLITANEKTSSYS